MFKHYDQVYFSQELGRYVERQLAPTLLAEIYTALEYLGPTFPWADYCGHRHGKFWLISIKGRFMWDQYETRKRGTLTRNPNYKLDGDLRQALERRPGNLAWLTVTLDFTGAFEAYHGTVDQLHTLGLKGSGVPMSTAAIHRNGYQLLKLGRHSFPFNQHPKVWAYDMWKSRM